MPRVSVIMSAYNAEKYIKEAIESILNQTFKDFEFIIINDGSTDSTKEIILFYNDSRIKILENHDNIGLVESLNKGIKNAKGEYVARMDADDISLSQRLEKQVDFLDKNREIALVGGLIEFFGTRHDGYIVDSACDPIIIKWLNIIKNQIAHASVLFRRETINRVGYYREKYKHAEDYDLWLRISKVYKIANIPEVLLKYRIHNDSISNKDKTRNVQKENVLELIFDNINHYINLSRGDFNLFIDAFKNGKISSIKNLLIVRGAYRRLFTFFIKKEKLNNEEIKKITPIYKKNNKLTLLWYLKTIFKF